MTDYNFKRVERKYSRITDKLSITKSQTLGMPTAFWDMHEIGKFKYAVLYYDQEKKALGIQFTNDEEAKDKNNIVSTKKYGGYISLKNFFRLYRIDHEKFAGKYNYEEVDVEGIGKIFVIEFQEVKTE